MAKFSHVNAPNIGDGVFLCQEGRLPKAALLRIASAATRLLGFVEAAAGVFSLFLMSSFPSARGGQ
jgi:hypothetical protein